MISGSIKFFPQCLRQYCLLFLKWILPRSLNFFDLIGMHGICAAKWTKNANSKYKTFTLLNQHRTALNAVYTNVHIVTYFTLIFFHSSIVKCDCAFLHLIFVFFVLIVESMVAGKKLDFLYGGWKWAYDMFRQNQFSFFHQ